MKKTLLPILAAVASIALCSCSGLYAGVKEKYFAYESCTKETFKTGTADTFYANTNPAGTTQADVVKKVVNALGDYGTGSPADLYFSTHQYVGMKYNGETINAYTYNETPEDEDSLTTYFGGFWIGLDDGFTSVKLLRYSDDMTSLVDWKYDLGRSSGHTVMGDDEESYLYETYATENSITYDKENKTLAVSVDVTFNFSLNDDSGSSTVTYDLQFKQD